MLAHRLLILLVQFGIPILDDLAHADLGEFLGHEFLIEQAAFDSGLILNEGGDHLIQVLVADAFGLLAPGFCKTLDLDLELPAYLR